MINDYPLIAFDEIESKETQPETDNNIEETEIDEESEEKPIEIDEEDIETDYTETEEPEDLEDEILVVYDIQPVTMEEIQFIIDTYEMTSPEERVKPHWQFEVSNEIMPEGYYCGHEDPDETFPYPYYTFFKYIITEEIEEDENSSEPEDENLPETEITSEPDIEVDLSAMAVTVDSEESFLQALENQVEEITLGADITISSLVGPPSYPQTVKYDIVKDLTINGQGHTLTVDYSGLNNNYFRLTGSGTLRIFDLNIISSSSYSYNLFSVYGSSSTVWNAEFTNFTFNGGGLIGQYNQAGANGSIGTVTFYGNTDIQSIDGSNTYAVIRSHGVNFHGNNTIINIIRNISNSSDFVNADMVELGNLSNASYITITANANITLFKSLASSIGDNSSGNFIVNPYTTVNLNRGISHGTRTLIDGYTNFHFKNNSNFTAEALTNASTTAIILSRNTFDFILEENASVILKSSLGSSTANSGNNTLILKKPDNGCLTFTIGNGASLEAIAYGTQYVGIHGNAPIQIQGNNGRPNSSSVTTIYGKLNTSANNGNGWSYQYSVLSISGKDTFTVDGGEVNLIADGTNLSSAEYAAFEHYNKNELELNIINGGYMNVRSNGWRAMSLAGGEALTIANAGIKTINVIGTGQNKVTGVTMPSTLELNGERFAIAAESQATLLINVLDGGHFYSNNKLDSNIYTTGSAVYTVSGEGSLFRICKDGISNGSTEYSLYGAIFHDAPVRGPLEIYVKDGGNMYVESNYGSRAAICAQTALTLQHTIKVTGSGSSLTVINNNTTDASVSNVIQDNALYPIGAIAFAANTSGNIYVENGGSFYAESHNPFSPTIALGGYGPLGMNPPTGTVFLDNPGYFDIRNDSDTGGDIRATAIRGRSYLPAIGLDAYLNTVTTNFSSYFLENTQLTLSVKNSDVTVYRTNGSNGTPSYEDWSPDTIIRSWRDATFTAGNIQTVDNIKNGDGSDAANGSSAGTTEINSFSLHTYGRITARGGYRVIYDGNRGKTSDNKTQYITGLYKYNSFCNVMDNGDIGFKLTGAVFVSWNTEPDGSGDSYVAGDVLTITGDITLYAIWKYVPDTQFMLPLTGGKGISAFTYTGIILMGVSSLFVYLGLRNKKIF